MGDQNAYKLYRYYIDVANAPAQYAALHQELGRIFGVMENLKETFDHNPQRVIANRGTFEESCQAIPKVVTRNR